MKRLSTLSFSLLLIMALLALSACELPAPGGGDPPTEVPVLTVPTTVPDTPTDTGDATTTDNGATTTDGATTDGTTTDNTATDGSDDTTTDDTTTDQPADGGSDTGDTGDTADTTDDTSDTGDTTDDNTGTDTGNTDDAEQPDNTASGTNRTHTVAAGETMGEIAEEYDVSVSALAAANNITNVDSIDAGQVLTIPDGDTADSGDNNTGSTGTEERVHVVQYGDNLFRIGLAYGFTAEELAAYNNIADVTRIDVGQIIKIPPNN